MESSPRFVRPLKHLGFGARALILLLAGAVLAGIMLPIGAAVYGTQGVVAAALSIVLCVVPALFSLAIARLFRESSLLVFGFMLGMVVRLAVPLAGCVLAFTWFRPLADSGMAFFLLAAYPLMLGLETLLLAADVPQPQASLVGGLANPPQPEAN